MSLSKCLAVGTTAGCVGGLVSAAYFTGMSERANKNDSPATFGLTIFSFASVIVSPFIGAVGGLSYYGLGKSIKYLRTAPPSTQVAVLTIVSSAIAIKSAYILGKK